MNRVLFFEERSGTAKYKAVKNALATMQVNKGQTAFVLDGSDGASGVCAAIEEAGYAVGRDIGVIGIHELPKNEFVSGELTYVAEPYEEIAETMVTQMLQSLEQREMTLNQATRVFECTLHAAGSTVR